MERTMRGGNRLFGSETALVDSLLSSSGFWKPPKARTEHTVSIHTHTHTHTCARYLANTPHQCPVDCINALKLAPDILSGRT